MTTKVIKVFLLINDDNKSYQLSCIQPQEEDYIDYQRLIIVATITKDFLEFTRERYSLNDFLKRTIIIAVRELPSITLIEKSTNDSILFEIDSAFLGLDDSILSESIDASITDISQEITDINDYCCNKQEYC